MKKLLIVLSAMLFALAALAQQPRPSPPGTADFSFQDGKHIAIAYSRPKINDPKTGQPRVIYGQLVPWGEPWRAGANEATSFTTDTDLTVGGTKVPAGKYTLYVQPEQNGTWKLIINKTTGQWGIPYPGAASDFARVDMKTSKLPSTVQQFTISFDKGTGKATRLNLDWENTRASVAIEEAK